MRNFLIWAGAAANTGFALWRLVMALSSVRRLMRGENGVTRGIALISGAMAIEEMIMAVTLARLGSKRDPFPTWLLWLRFLGSWLAAVPSITYFMQQSGFFDMFADWLRGRND